MKKILGLSLVLAVTLAASQVQAAIVGSIFLTGHDPDFHAQSGGTGAQHINQVAIGYVMDPGFNEFVDAGISKFLFVESAIALPGGHRVGKRGIIDSGFVEGVDFDHVTAAGLNAALDVLGTNYSAIVIASDFGGLLTQAELDILNARSADIIGFLNAGGGLYAMAEGDGGTGLTPGGGHFGFLPFVVSSTSFDSSEAGATVTLFGASLGLTDADVSFAFSHNVFDSAGTGGLAVVDTLPSGQILSLAGRGRIDADTGIMDIPEPTTLVIWSLLATLGLSVGWRRRRRAA